jgi:hypothetical protein
MQGSDLALATLHLCGSNVAQNEDIFHENDQNDHFHAFNVAAGTALIAIDRTKSHEKEE